MNEIRLAPGPEDFIWAGGIEDTFVPQTKRGHRALDEYELMGHYDHWREDLALARDLGLKAIRWGVPWYRVEPEQGRFDWSWIDQVIPHLVEELGITPIIDLMHYGCPFWLQREFANPEYPGAVAAYARAFARRYGHLVRWYTPLNEPLINSLLCGTRGVWPPYLLGDQGYVTVMMQLVRGILETVEALQEVNPRAMMVHVEAVGLSRAAREELEHLAFRDRHRGYLSYDLLTGMVSPEHPLFPWLLENGVTEVELEEIAGRQIRLDVVGLNFYPQWSTKQIYVDKAGRVVRRNVEKEGSGFAELIEDFYQRYRAPILITETSAKGSHEVRARWLHSSVATIKQLRSDGVPVYGYTWFPLTTMIDWAYRKGRRPLEEYRIELGLYSLNGATPGGRWEASPLVEQYRRYVQNSAEAVGTLRQDAHEGAVGAAQPHES